MPLYIVYARQELGAPPRAIGWFMLAQVLGGVLANLVWARLIDERGSRHMLSICATVSTLTPALAVLLARVGWTGLLPVIFLGGATFNGRQVGFSSALLELAPATERPTYSALNVGSTEERCSEPRLGAICQPRDGFVSFFQETQRCIDLARSLPVLDSRSAAGAVVVPNVVPRRRRVYRHGSAVDAALAKETQQQNMKLKET